MPDVPTSRYRPSLENRIEVMYGFRLGLAYLSSSGSSIVLYSKGAYGRSDVREGSLDETDQANGRATHLVQAVIAVQADIVRIRQGYSKDHSRRIPIRQTRPLFDVQSSLCRSGRDSAWRAVCTRKTAGIPVPCPLVGPTVAPSHLAPLSKRSCA